MKIALVHDWLVEMGDREKIFLSLAELFPGADVFTLVYDRALFDPHLGMRKIKVSALQSIPGGIKNYQAFFPIYWELMGRLDLAEYDLVVSSSAVCAKWVRVSKTAMHVCYCHRPWEATWNLPDAIFDPSGFSPSHWPGSLFNGYLKYCDRLSNQGVKHFMAASAGVQTKIKGLYGRDSDVFFPPIETEHFQKPKEEGQYFLLRTTTRPTATVVKTVAAFKKEGLPLMIWVQGETLGRWAKTAKDAIQVENQKSLPWAEALCGAKALVCLEEEECLVPAGEALAAGCPLWVLEDTALVDVLTLGETGLRFTVQDLKKDATAFDKTVFSVETLRQKANRFSKARALFRIQVYFRRLFGIETQIENENL